MDNAIIWRHLSAGSERSGLMWCCSVWRIQKQRSWRCRTIFWRARVTWLWCCPRHRPFCINWRRSQAFGERYVFVAQACAAYQVDQVFLLHPKIELLGHVFKKILCAHRWNECTKDEVLTPTTWCERIKIIPRTCVKLQKAHQRFAKMRRQLSEKT